MNINNAIKIINAKKSRHAKIYLNIPVIPDEMPKYIKQLKAMDPGMLLMVGPVCSAAQFKCYVEAGADGCVLYERPFLDSPIQCNLPTLIQDAFCMKHQYKLKPKIIVGGVECIEDAVKAVACGADHVLMYKPIIECWESAAPMNTSGKQHRYYLPSDSRWKENPYMAIKKNGEFNVHDNDLKIVPEDLKQELITYNKLFKNPDHDLAISDYYKQYKVTEDVLRIKYTALGLQNIFIFYMCHAMTYTGCKTLDDFKGIYWLI